ncbi:MAG: methylase [Gammaproteobacteria bacterium]|jgi:adenine-specific DNA-methyltransferase|nr:methylase [Gammaproteobacteria bacterium]
MPILHWLNREKSIREVGRAPYRLLKADPKLSYGDPKTENMLVQGDNLDALKALLPYYASKIKCIFIDPPYNTKSAFEHYDDNLEHTKWLEMMYPRLELLRELLSEDGSIWATIDDNESHYLKVIMDEIFGRKNFVANCIWQKKYAASNDARYISDVHDTVLCYAKNKDVWKVNLLPRSQELNSKYKNPDNDPRGPWYSTNLSVKTYSEKNDYIITSPQGRDFRPPPSRCWVVSKEKYEELLIDNRIWFGKDGTSRPYEKKFLSEVQQGVVPTTLWLHQDSGHNIQAKSEIRKLFENQNNLFSTPKPEKLIQRIFTLATSENDLVLDSFLGSGTTAAVAHKMGRRYIGIEMGEHAKTHCAVRLQKVIEGEQGGISKDVNWQGGSGFRYYYLGEAIFDEDGRINPEIRFAHLAAHIWFSETRTPYLGNADSPLLGFHNGVAYYLLYNGILGDKRPQAGNVLTSKTLETVPDHNGPKVIYGEISRLGAAQLIERQIIFKQTPYDIKAR